MNQNRLMTVLRAPVISEKSTFVAEKNEKSYLMCCLTRLNLK